LISELVYNDKGQRLYAPPGDSVMVTFPRCGKSIPARGLMFIERYGRLFPSQRGSHLYVTPVTTLQYVKGHPEIIDGVRLGDRIYHSGIQGGIGLCPSSRSSFCASIQSKPSNSQNI
jgi:hypothetical protein